MKWFWLEDKCTLRDAWAWFLLTKSEEETNNSRHAAFTAHAAVHHRFKFCRNPEATTRIWFWISWNSGSDSDTSDWIRALIPQHWEATFDRDYADLWCVRISFRIVPWFSLYSVGTDNFCFMVNFRWTNTNWNPREHGAELPPTASSDNIDWPGISL